MRSWACRPRRYIVSMNGVEIRCVGNTHHPESVKSVEDAKNGKHNSNQVAAPRLQPLAIIGQISQTNSLSFASLPESNVDNRTTNPTDETRRIRQVHEPVEDHGRAISNIQIRKCTEDGTCADSSVRNSILPADAEESWCVAGHGETIEGARGEEHERISGRPG